MKQLLIQPIFLIVSAAALMAATFPNADTSAGGSLERYLLVTDRGHYISGEEVYYRVFEIGSGIAWSKVLYVELVSPGGQSLQRSKISLGPSGFSGKIGLPTGISTGTYYLKAYTRWMRNCQPASFSYTSIQVYDPFIEAILPLDSTAILSEEQEFNFMEEGLQPGGLIRARTDKEVYRIREEVSLHLTSGSPLTVDLSISVVAQGLLSNQHHICSGCALTKGPGEQFLPETQGVSLTGRAVGKSDKNPAPYATIYVSILGPGVEFLTNYSDSTGRFYFTLPPIEGNRDLFVSAYHPGIEELELQIDRDFSNEPIRLPSYPANLDSSMALAVTTLSVNAQVTQQYYPRLQDSSVPDDSEELPFYGHPSVTIRFEDFIRLPALEEYFTEVIPQVNLRKNRGVPRLVVQGDHPDLEIYPPLVMVDGVAIFNIDAFLNVSPRLVDRIEIITAPYVRGNVTFGGIINMVTTSRDLGYIDLPSSGMLVRYQMLDQHLSGPLISTMTDPRLPDVRNTLYWEPSVVLEPAGEKVILFTTPDVTGRYEIVIRGMDPSGKPIYTSIPFGVE
jgi:hypothetical protein